MRRSLGVFLSEDGDNARIGCARRVMDGRHSEIESLPAARPYLESGRVVLIDIGKSEMSLSSSGLRTQCQCWIGTGNNPLLTAIGAKSRRL